MNLFIDGEWDGSRLLSMAVVPLAGPCWYKVFSDQAENEWVRTNVLPHLNEAPTDRLIAQKSLESFLFRFPKVHIIADWPEDIAQFCNFLITGPGKRMDTPPLTFEILRFLNSDRSKVPHNALHDAQAMRRMYLEAYTCHATP